MPPWTPLDADLNGPQRAAVDLALAAERVAAIHGPPGTGKTRTLVEVIRQAVAAGQRVLATAASNLAVDNLAERLVAAGVEVIRLGHPARVLPTLEDRLLAAVVRADPGAALAREWQAEARRAQAQLEKQIAKRRLERAERREAWRAIRSLHRDARAQLDRTRRAVLANASVICATAAGADATLLGDLTFDLCVVDEATQAPDPLALVALARAPRAVLAGDPCQLPPTVIDRRAEQGGLGRTAFERLAERCPDAVRMLEVQHRMHGAIMAYPSHAHYGGRLRADPAVADHTLEELGLSRTPSGLRRSPWSTPPAAAGRRSARPTTRAPATPATPSGPSPRSAASCHAASPPARSR